MMYKQKRSKKTTHKFVNNQKTHTIATKLV